VHLGGTEYAKVIVQGLWGLPPALDMAMEKRVHSAIRKIVNEGWAESAHDLSDGGLGVALAESSFGRANVGARIALDSDLRPEFALFHEGPSRILISTSEPEKIRAIADEFNVEAVTIGVTIEGRLQITNRSNVLVDSELTVLREPWQNSLEHLLHTT
jgi:phosphoribosylformylglycinamidine synthase